MKISEDIFRHYNRDEKSSYSAEVITKLLNEIIKPNSVVDVGCGVGTFLKTFKQYGVKEVLGLDSTQYLDLKNLKISEEEFLDTDLQNPKKLMKKYDLVLSLEVAEHLPPSVADKFISYLTSASNVVCFSAAIPGQGGKGHFNEQWMEYWIDKFGEKNFVFIDCIRPYIWNDIKILEWYKMNTVLFVKRRTNAYKHIISQDLKIGQLPSVVHPERHEKLINENLKIKNKYLVKLNDKINQLIKYIKI